METAEILVLVALGLSSEILPLFSLMKWVTAMMAILLGARIVPLSGGPGGHRHPIGSGRLGGAKAAIAVPPPHCARCPAAVLVVGDLDPRRPSSHHKRRSRRALLWWGIELTVVDTGQYTARACN